jgi:hypothetical protein
LEPVSQLPGAGTLKKPGRGDGKIVGKAAKPGRWVPLAGNSVESRKGARPGPRAAGCFPSPLIKPDVPN